jgi:hypothetical protein
MLQKLDELLKLLENDRRFVRSVHFSILSLLRTSITPGPDWLTTIHLLGGA